MKHKNKVSIILAIITLVAIFISNRLSVVERVEASEIVEQVAQAQPDKLDAWLDKLAKKENCGKGIIDKNGKGSYGPYCYQTATYKAFSKKYGITDQRELTRAIIENERRGYMHWRCSVVGCPKWGIVGIGKPNGYE